MCGIFALYNNETNNSNIKNLIKHLKKLQHRGKDGYGIVYIENESLITVKDKGEINSMLFNRLTNINSKSALGHLRYSTSGVSVKKGVLNRTELQPIRGFSSDIGPFYIAHNGNIPNTQKHDTLYIKDLLEQSGMTFEEKLINVIKKIPAAFSVVILTSDNTMYLLRDRFGIRPLCFGNDGDKYYVSSESCAFSHNIDYIRDVHPGELIKIDENGYQTLFQYDRSQHNLCTFEILYFLNENSYVDGLHIKNIRNNLGKILAKKEDILNNEDEYIVSGIPLTGILYGKSYAESMGFTYKQLIHKNKAISRTFIILNDKDRKKACNDKFMYDENEIKGKKVVLVDDTIVRGNVIKAIISNFKKCGAAEIHVRIPGPPVIDICELGISIQTKEELIMHNSDVDIVCKEIGANSLKYLNVSDLEHFPKKSYNQCFTSYIDPEIKANTINT